MIRLEPVIDFLPPGFEALRAEALAEGWNHIERLAAEWSAGEQRFREPGEVLLAGFAGDVLAAIGGLTVDLTMPTALRMRRFYVRPAVRRIGVGRAIALMLLDRARATCRPVTVHAGPGSAPFWESLGFIEDCREGHSHIFDGNAARATASSSRGL
jgi:GNAT superfamily N-acetyltransferase